MGVGRDGRWIKCKKANSALSWGISEVSFDCNPNIFVNKKGVYAEFL